jgi:hypothetical protein
MSLRDDKVLMATLALRGVRFKRITGAGHDTWSKEHEWSGWYWMYPPATNWVGSFKTRHVMLTDAAAWMDGAACGWAEKRGCVNR